MGELAVLGIFLGLWRALSSGEQVGRDDAEAVLGWVLVAVSVLLALTAIVPDSLTESGDVPCRAATCPQPRTEGVPQNRNPLTVNQAPGTNSAPGVVPTPGLVLQLAG